MKIDLEKLSNSELKDLVLAIKNELQVRKKEIEDAESVIEECKEIRQVKWESHYSRRETAHYVARLKYVKGKGIEHCFVPFEKTHGQAETFVSGEFTIRDGEIYDIRDTNGRHLYLVYNLELIKLGESKNAEVMHLVKGYLKHKENPESLLELLKLKKVNIHHPELIDDGIIQ